MGEVRVNVSDVLVQIETVIAKGSGWRYPARKLLRQLADSSWADGYADGVRDHAEDNEERRAQMKPAS